MSQKSFRSQSGMAGRFAFASLLVLMGTAMMAQMSPPAFPAGTVRPHGGRGGFGFERARLPFGIKAERNIPYVKNGGPNQVLDIFPPETPSAKPLPLMIWVNGGAWLGGDQHDPPVLFLVTNGFAVASIQYRFSSQVKWPGQAYDVKAAIRFLRANAARYNFDPGHFGIGGDSAGGHLAAFAGTSGDVKSMEGDLGNPGYSTKVQAVVDWFGPTDLTQMEKEAKPGSWIQHNSPDAPEALLLGGPVQQMKELAATANPITYITSNEPPFLIMHGDNDLLVPWGQSDILAKALIDAGNEVTMKTIHGAGHEDRRFHSPANQRLMLDFLTLHLKTEP
ncbi:MAG: alpha/beta hydrolase fold domain-containing protein [Limisphaerales bacterium]